MQRTGSESLCCPVQLGAGACGCAVFVLFMVYYSSSSSLSTGKLIGLALGISYKLGLLEQPSESECPGGKIKTVAVTKQIFVLRSVWRRGVCCYFQKTVS